LITVSRWSPLIRIVYDELALLLVERCVE